MSKIDLTPRLVPGKMNEKGVSVRLENVRLTFVNLDKPQPGYGGDVDKSVYTVTAIIPAKHFKRIKSEFEKLFNQMRKINKTLPTTAQFDAALKKALADGQEGSLFKIGNEQLDKEGNVRKGLADSYTIRAEMAAVVTENGFKPRFDLTLRDRNNQPVPLHRIREEFYAGVWGDVAMTITTYEYMKKPGLKAYLNGIMKTVNDERLSSFDPFTVRDDLPEEDVLGDTAQEYPDEEKPPKKRGK